MAKVALVTGGAVRVGRAISLGLAEAGWDVAVNYHTSGGEARELAERIEAMGRRCTLHRADVAEPGDVRAMTARLLEEHGRLDLVVNSASLFLSTPLLEIPPEEWDRVMAVNVRGPHLVVQASADALTETGGSVINLVDVSAFRPWRDHPHHSVSKAALLHLTRVMARALAPRVRVNAIAPGTVLPPEGYDDADRERSRRRTAVGRLGTPEDVVRTVLFLTDSPFITGEVVVVDGGRLLEG